MEPISLAVGALLRPFLADLTSGASDALSDRLDATRAKLREFARQAWHKLLGVGGNPGLMEAADAASQRNDAQSRQDLDREITRAMGDLGSGGIAELVQILHEAERFGGPVVTTAGDIALEVRGDGNVAIGQNSGQINIGGGR